MDARAQGTFTLRLVNAYERWVAGEQVDYVVEKGRQPRPDLQGKPPADQPTVDAFFRK